MIISNRVRAVIWMLILFVSVYAGFLLDAILGFRLDPILSRIAGAALLAVILRAAAVTGRYLSVYGHEPGAPRGSITKLVRAGPYACMRHPMHFFLSMTPIAIGLMLASPSAVLTGIVAAILVLVLAVKVDEAESLERFGEEYERYRREVPAFNLHPRCLLLALYPMPRRRRETSLRPMDENQVEES